MKLSIRDRLMIAQLFPREGSLITQTIVRDLSEKFKLTQEEITKVDLREVRNGNAQALQWDVIKEGEPTEYSLTNLEIDFLKKQVARLDKEEKITAELLNLCSAIQVA